MPEESVAQAELDEDRKLATSLAGRRFVVSGTGRLTARVATLLAARSAAVTVIGEEADDAADLQRTGVRLVPARHDVEGTLRDAEVAGADALLALADDDLENLRTVVTAAAVAPAVPVVLRAFDAALADELEAGLNVRRAYSVSSIAAPTFVAAALEATVVETLRLGDVQVPIAILDVGEDSKLHDKRPSEVKSVLRCAVLGHAASGETWRYTTGDDHVIRTGDRVAIGGPLLDVLSVAKLNSPLWQRPAPRVRPWRHLLTERRELAHQRTGFGATLLPLALWGFLVLVVATMVTFALALHLGPIDALYQAILTAFGSPSFAETDPWLKVVAVSAVIAGGALIGVLFGWVAAVATTERMEQRMGRHARLMSGHVVLAGLGRVGYQVERLLFQLKIPVAVVDRTPDERFTSSVGERTPVLHGDVRLPENLERAGIANARCLLAVTDDDLGNVEACIQTRRINRDARTVARIYDDDLPERLPAAYGIDESISATRVAARAFVGAAIDERAKRPFVVGDLRYLGMRHTVAGPVPMQEVEAWRARGIRILGVQREGEVRSPATIDDSGLHAGDRIVVAGPEAAMTETFGGTAPS